MKFKVMFLSAVICLSSLSIGIVNSYAYRIFNRTDLPIYFLQTLGGEVRSTIAPGHMIACKWSRHICNSDGRIDSYVTFRIEYLKGDQKLFICNVKTIAGGAVVVTGYNGSYKCTPYGTGGGH